MQYGLGCIGRSGCDGPEIRQDIHVLTASMTLYDLVNLTETNLDAKKFELVVFDTAQETFFVSF